MYPYLNDPCPENMPILEDLYNLLRSQEEKEAQYIATALEIYVTGSLNVFNHQSNVDINNRIVCYDIMKKHGHYCKICGEYKANEKFSGKGHAAHICKSCASLPAEKQAELMTLNRLLNLPWGLSKEQLSWLKNRLKDRRPDVRALAQEQYEMRFPPKHLEDDKFKFFDEESFIE